MKRMKKKVHLERVTPYRLADLERKVQNTFSRITLVKYNIDKERITIDFEILHYNNNLLKFDFSNIVIVEVKQEKNFLASDFIKLMHGSYMQPYSFPANIVLALFCLMII